MSLKIRDINYVYYRLFFVALLFGFGVISFIVLLFESMGINVIQVGPRTSYDSVIMTSWVASIISTACGYMMWNLMKERRTVKKGDRRQRNIPIDFPDRRRGDRRSGKDNLL